MQDMTHLPTKCPIHRLVEDEGVFAEKCNCGQEGWKKEFYEKFPNSLYDEMEVNPLNDDLESFIRQVAEESYAEGFMEGKKNPPVGMLRQWLNERPAGSRLLTDEDLLEFLRI